LLGSRRSVLGAFFCILLVVLYVILNPKNFIIPNSSLNLYLHITAWGSFLILAGAVVGKQREGLQSKFEETRQLYDQLLASHKDVMDARAATIMGLATLAESRDNETGAHLERMREYVKILAGELADHPKYQGYITRTYIEDIYQSAILHDIGKVGVPDRVLLKPGKLTPEEFDIIKTHTTIGGDAIKSVEVKVQGQSFLTIGKEIAYFHHEKWDGSGYPQGLQGADIPLSARITALADVYDALTSERVYKDAMPDEKVQEIILEGKGRHFDPDVVDAYLMSQNKFEEIREKINGRVSGNKSDR
jgi:response regulator RpfG family c-di-GMP phosphodiesterase